MFYMKTHKKDSLLMINLQRKRPRNPEEPFPEAAHRNQLVEESKNP